MLWETLRERQGSVPSRTRSEPNKTASERFGYSEIRTSQHKGSNVTNAFRVRTLAVALVALALPSGAHAGLYYSGEQFAELPSRPAGFLTDHRALRAAGYERPDGLPSPLRGDYVAAAERLEKHATTRALTADEAADLGALLLRLGKPEKALNVLAPAARKFPEHFRAAANLGTAFQASGDSERAATQLEEAVRLAPAKLKPFEQAHLKLLRLRLKEGKGA